MNRLKKLCASSIEPEKKDIVKSFFNVLTEVVDCYAIVNHDLSPYMLKENPAQGEDELISVFIEDGGLESLKSDLQTEGFDISKLDDSYLTKIISSYDHYTNMSVIDELEGQIDMANSL